MFQVLKFVGKLFVNPEGINMGDKHVQKIGDRIEHIKDYPEERRIQREQLEWDAEKEKIAQHSRKVRAKWVPKS
jgi:hypothetical protein